MEPVAIQQRFLFPAARSRRGFSRSSSRKSMAVVTLASGDTVSGEVEYLDNFNISLRDAEGRYHSIKRTRDVQVTIDNPYQAHINLLDTITDEQIHDVVAYLESLQ
jgi:hypothetical protein